MVWDRRKWAKEYRDSHKKEAQDYRDAHKKEWHEYNAIYRLTHKAEIKQQKALHGYEYKVKTLTHYGNGRLACVRCGFADVRALSIDHIYGGGKEHMKVINKTGSHFYRWLIMGNFPKGYQTLCFNCQWIKRAENGEYSHPIERNLYIEADN